jgi:hypothetical protein
LEINGRVLELAKSVVQAEVKYGSEHEEETRDAQKAV